MLTASTQFLPNSQFLRAYNPPVRASIFFPKVDNRARLIGSRNLKMLSHSLEMTLNPIIEKRSSIKENSICSPNSNTYEQAMEALSSLITSKKRGEKSTVRGKIGKLDRMQLYIKILGLESHISKLKIIHVAGTKGKGSTCSFCEAILRNCGFRTGLFTSPHLVDVRERFRINGEDISEEKFLSYFWECWDTLKENLTEELPMPPLFQFLTVLACKIFTCEQVDVAIIEVGLGGKKDSTNFIKEPVVCGIASLGMDHVEALGGTLSSIASHKAGIFKPNVPAFTAPQLPEAMDALVLRAKELQIDLTVADPLKRDVKLSLAGEHQYINASLAVHLCKSWLMRTGNWEKIIQNENELPEAFSRGLSTTCLSGRGQVVSENFSNLEGGKLYFYLDGAHSPESMEACAKWFSSSLQTNGDSLSKIQILLFNCMDVRDPHLLLSRLVNICAASGISFKKAIFVPSISSYNQVTSGHSSLPSDLSSKDLTWQLNLQKIWGRIVNEKDDSYAVYRDALPSLSFPVEDGSVVFSSLPLVIKWLRGCAVENPSSNIQVLVTGSLHLVGDVIKILGK